MHLCVGDITDVSLNTSKSRVANSRRLGAAWYARTVLSELSSAQFHPGAQSTQSFTPPLIRTDTPTSELRVTMSFGKSMYLRRSCA